MKSDRQFNCVTLLFAKLIRLPTLMCFAVCGVIIATIPINQSLASPTSPSSYQNSCTDLNVTGATLSGKCRRRNGRDRRTSILIRGIYNNNGTLTYTNDPTAVSTYQNSCDNTRLAPTNTTLLATCRQINGDFNDSRIQIRGIYNNDGFLAYSR